MRRLVFALLLAAGCACPKYQCDCICEVACLQSTPPVTTCPVTAHADTFGMCAPDDPVYVMNTICEDRFQGTCTSTCWEVD